MEAYTFYAHLLAALVILYSVCSDISRSELLYFRIYENEGLIVNVVAQIKE